MMISKDKAERFLSLSDVSDFWLELGGKTSLPDSFVYLYDDGAMIVLEPFNDMPGFTGIHIAVLPESRGKNAIEFAKLCIQWAFDSLSTVKILARIQKQRTNVIRFSEAAGMKKYNEDDTHYYCEVSKCL